LAVYTGDVLPVQSKKAKGGDEMMLNVPRWGSFSLAGLARWLWLKLRGKTIMVTGSCRGCGRCCTSICLEGPDGWLRSEAAFAKILAKYPEYSRFSIIGRDGQGFLLFACTWRTAEGSCAAHEERLTLCRRYPESSLAFAGGRLLPGCGYRFVEVVPFARVLRRELTKVK
jgi:hypothetical protein